jgi:hypothetical protein
MEHFELLNIPPNLGLGERRESLRHQVNHLIAITSKGTGKVIDINFEGLCIGCLYPHSFPLIMKIDILGANGTFLKGMHVIKCWENDLSSTCDNTDFEITIGLEFINLNSSQSFELVELMRQIELNGFIPRAQEMA